MRSSLSRLRILVLSLLTFGLMQIGCVELSRTEKTTYGSPTQRHTAGPDNQFDAENFEPPTNEKKGFFERMFD